MMISHEKKRKILSIASQCGELLVSRNTEDVIDSNKAWLNEFFVDLPSLS